MRLTALCICGTVLACLSLSWSTADSDEGDLLGDHGFGPCIATLRPEWPCRQGQGESTCPYLFSLPPLTLQLPKQLGELEKIVTDLQKLKDNVDQLRRMCADCTVSQTERECEKQKEIEHENLNEDTDRHKDERNCLNERTERPKDFGKEGGTDRVKAEKTRTGNGDSDSKKRMILEERGRKKWEAERESNKGVVKESERSKNVKEMAEKDGKTMTEVAKGNDKSGQAKVPISGGNERTVDVREMPVEKNNSDTETDIDKDYDGKGDSNGDPEGTMENGKDTSNWKNKEKTEESEHHMWQGETKETEKKTRTEEERGSDEIKMSEGRDEHTNKEREQQGTEREKEMEKGIKVERNNEKSKQAESIGRAEKERTIKEGEDRETGTDIKTDGEKTVQSVQRDSDGELVSSKASERTDFVSISSTPHSIISLAPRHDSMDSTKAITFTSSLPSPSLSSSTSHWITDVSQQTIMVADTLPTQSTYLRPAGISEHPSSDVEENFRTTAKTTVNTLEGPGHQITSPTSRLTSTTSVKPEAVFPGHVSSTTTTTTPHQDFYTTMFPGVADRSRWTGKKNITANKTGVRQLPGRGPKPGEKHKPANKPEAGQKLQNPKNDRKHDQKQQPPHQKPTTNQKSKPGKHSKVQIPTQPDHLTTDQSLKINQIPKQDQEHTTDQLSIEKQEFHQKATLPAQRQPVNTTVSDEDLRTGQKPESVEIPATTQISKPENNLVHPFKTNKPDQPQKTHKKLKSDEKTKPDQRLTLNPYLTPVQQPKKESETINLMPRPSQKSKIELMENSDENPSPKPNSVKDSTPGQKLTPDRALTKLPDQKSKLSQKIPKINQKPKPHQKHPVVVTGQKIKPKVKPKLDQTSQTNVGTPLPDQIFNLNPETLPGEITEAITNKPSKPRAPPRRRPIIRPGATPVQRPKPAVQQRPSPKTHTDLEPLQISGTTSDDIQHSQSDVAPAPGPVTQTAEVSHFPGDTKFRPSTMKSITLGPKTSNSLESGPVPRPHTLSEGFTVSPNSRITSDLRPQTAGQPPSIPMTTRPNKIIRGILPSVIPSIWPGSTKQSQASNTDSSLAEILLNVEETELRQTPDPDTMMIPVLNLSAQTASAVNPDLRSTTPDTSGLQPPAVEASTPSARELRVKINQVAAFFNNSLSPHAGPLDRHPKEHTEDNQGDSRPHRPDSKLPPQIPSKVSMAKDCADHLLRGKTKSAVYLVTPDLRSRSFPVLCDMELDGGGWTLLQQRLDGSVSFNRTWADYRSGFGELDGGEFWLGNNMIHLLTRDRDVVLRVELEDFDGVMEYAEYEQFRVASERMRYRLTVGGYSGTAGDALRFSKSYDHNNKAFTTPDRDHDRYPSGNCGAYYSSGWWFDACMAANLNGRYYAGRYKGVRDGIFWGTWQNISTEYYPTNDRQSFKTVRMMIRPKGFAP